MVYILLQAFGSELSHIGVPMYDIGGYLGNLISWYYIHLLSEEGKLYAQQMERFILESMNVYRQGMELSPCDYNKALAYVAGFTGIHILYR